jgi:hypothetical protein
MYSIAQLADVRTDEDFTDRPVTELVSGAIQAFTGEATRYCNAISDSAAHLYAQRYIAALEQRALNHEFLQPRNPGVFEPNRKLIRATLDDLYRKHFPPQREPRRRFTPA